MKCAGRILKETIQPRARDTSKCQAPATLQLTSSQPFQCNRLLFQSKQSQCNQVPFLCSKLLSQCNLVLFLCSILLSQCNQVLYKLLSQCKELLYLCNQLLKQVHQKLNLYSTMLLRSYDLTYYWYSYY